MHKKMLSIAAAAIFIFILTGCTGGSKTSGGTGTGNQPNVTDTPKATEAPKDNKEKVEESFTDFFGNKPARMSGNGSKEYKLMMDEGGYRFVMKTKDLIKGLKSMDLKSGSSGASVPLYTSAGAGRDDSGWYVYERVEHMYSKDETIFVVEADGPYEIEVYKLPESNNISLPITIKGKGTRAIGPFTAVGALNINLKTADANSSGFMASFVDAATGQMAESVYMNVENSAIVNEFDVTKSVTPAGSGSYFLHITANTNCEWEVNIAK